MTDLFSRISQIVPKMEGWSSVSKAWSLAGAVLGLRPACVVEIGVWGGRSLLPMAMALRTLDSGQAIAIDPWSAEASKVDMQGADLEFWKQSPPHELAYRSYLDWINRLGVARFVKTIRAKSDDVEPPPCIDIMHIDGNHGEQAHRDCQRFGPRLRVGGLCFCDDLGWTGGGVDRGLEYLKGIGFTELYKLDTGIMLQRIRE